MESWLSDESLRCDGADHYYHFHHDNNYNHNDDDDACTHHRCHSNSHRGGCIPGLSPCHFTQTLAQLFDVGDGCVPLLRATATRTRPSISHRRRRQLQVQVGSEPPFSAGKPDRPSSSDDIASSDLSSTRPFISHAHLMLTMDVFHAGRKADSVDT